MVNYCIVRTCKNYTGCWKGIKLCRFPSKDKKEERRLWWLLAGQNYEDSQECDDFIEKSRICCEHFVSFHTWICMREGKQLSGCRCSPNGLIPSLKLPPCALSPDVLLEVKNHHHKRKRSENRISSPSKRQRLEVSSSLQETNSSFTPASPRIVLADHNYCPQQTSPKLPVLDIDESHDISLSGEPIAIQGTTSNLCEFGTKVPVKSPIKKKTNESWSVKRAKKTASLAKIQNDDVIEVGPVFEQRVPPLHDYSRWSRDDLIQFLQQKDQEIETLKAEKRQWMETEACKEKETKDICDKSLSQQNQISYLGNCLDNVTAANKRLKEELQLAWQKGSDAGKKIVMETFEKIFSDAQIKALLTEKRVCWDKEDIASAIALYACSRKAYLFVRKKMGIPLPSESTIRRWASKIKIRPGIQEDVLIILGKLSKTLPESERLVCVSFDEVQLSKRAQYAQGEDAIYGPHTHAQVIMMRPLIGNWKQPVYFQFDAAMDKECFDNVTKRLYEVGFIVVASVCDLGTTNQGFLSEMGVFNTDCSSYPHPSDQNLKIFFFADAPHMLKLFRNHFIDYGYTWKKQTCKVDVLKTTISMAKGITDHPGMAEKLNLGLLELNPKARMRVLPAAQLISKTTADAITYLYKKEALKNRSAELAAEMILTVDSWFDVMNSRESEKHANDLRCALGKNWPIQRDAILNMSIMTKNMRVGNHKGLIPFQKGVLMTNLSILALKEYLETNYNIKEIITSRLNQDCLEGYFAWIRSAGLNYTTPTALDFVFRFKKYLLSKSTTHFADRTNCKDEASSTLCFEMLLSLEKTECLTAAVIEDIVDSEAASGDNENPSGLEGDCQDESEISAELPYSDQGIPNEPPECHHLSKEMRNYTNTLTSTNGILIMAIYLAKKFPNLEGKCVGDEKFMQLTRNSMFNKEDLNLLKEKSWLIELVKEMELQFVQFHGGNTSDFNHEEGVNKKLSQNIVDKTSCDLQLAMAFVRTRLFMRLRDHNLPIRNASLNCSNKSYAKYYSYMDIFH